MVSHSPDKNIFLEVSFIARLNFKSLDDAEDLKFKLEIKETSKKMFLSGEWDATSILLENTNLIENKLNDLPYIKFNTN